MNFLEIAKMFLWYLILFSLVIFLIGINETVRNEGFTIVESNILIQNETPAEIWQDYQDVKGTYIFTNTPFINLANFLGYSILFLIFIFCWRKGRNSPPFELNNILTSFSLLFVLVVYLFNLIAEYIINIFRDQLILVLYADIYNSIYMYKILVENFIYFIIFGYFISWLGNKIKNFEPLKNF